MNLTQIHFPNKLARMVLEYPDDEEPVASTQGPLEGVAVKYNSLLDSLLSFVHGCEYDKNKAYTKRELRAITPTDVLSYMDESQDIRESRPGKRCEPNRMQK